MYNSGANDGAAMPLLYLPLILIDSGKAGVLKEWILSILIKSIALGIVLGAMSGFAANRLLKYSQHHDLIDKQSFIAFSLALSVRIQNSKASISLILASDNVIHEFGWLQ